MGSSKKHKEKRDRKKHKKDRSRSRERDRDSHKKSHKSSHRRDKRKSPEPGSPDSDLQLSKRRHISDEEEILLGNRESSSSRTHPRTNSDEEFDVDQLLDSKLSENPEFSSLKRPSKKHKDDLRKRHSFGENEDSLEKFATEQLLEEHGARDVVKRNRSPPAETFQIPFISDVRVKEEPQDADRHDSATEDIKHIAQMPLTAAERQKRRRDKLKNEGKYEDYKKKNKAEAKISRDKKRNELAKLPYSVQNKVKSKIRENVRKRVAKYRAVYKQASSSSVITPSKNNKTFGKAVSRAKRSLPKSPRKKKADIKKFFKCEIDQTDAPTSPCFTDESKHMLPKETVNLLKQFTSKIILADKLKAEKMS